MNHRSHHRITTWIAAGMLGSLCLGTGCAGTSASNTIETTRDATRPGTDRTSTAASPDFNVESSFGGADGGSIRTTIAGSRGTPIKHGLQVTLGADGWMQLVEVYDRGELRERTQLHHNGHPFRFQSRGGRGTENFESVSDVNGWTLYHGVTRDDEPWFGIFLVREWIPESQGKQRLMLYEFRNGERIGRSPFPIERLGLGEMGNDLDAPMWNIGSWPLREVDMEQ